MLCKIIKYAFTNLYEAMKYVIYLIAALFLWLSIYKLFFLQKTYRNCIKKYYKAPDVVYN